MPKCSLISKVLQLRVSTCAIVILCLIGFVNLVFIYTPYEYKHLSQDDIETYLFKATNPMLVLKKSKPDCKYDYVLKSTSFINAWDVPERYDEFTAKGLVNGSFSPEHCNAIFSVAILVTYRNRQKQLDVFLPYMHDFLRKQNIHYKIYILEQQDEKPWNKGLLYNIGAKQAMSDKFPCIILHDVDLLPLDESNLYTCLQQPRHMSASIDKFRFVLPYENLVGGVLAMAADQYKQINGLSNQFENWGGEDDELFKRMTYQNIDLWRLPRSMSRYKMLFHRHESVNSKRYQIMQNNKDTYKKDGLNSIHYDSIHVKNTRLFTHIVVKL